MQYDIAEDTAGAHQTQEPDAYSPLSIPHSASKEDDVSLAESKNEASLLNLLKESTLFSIGSWLKLNPATSAEICEVLPKKRKSLKRKPN